MRFTIILLALAPIFAQINNSQITIIPKTDLTATGELRFRDRQTSPHYVGFKAQATISADLTWSLPAADGTAGQCMQTNGSGVLSFGTCGGSGYWSLSGSNVTFLTGRAVAAGMTVTAGNGYGLNGQGSNAAWALHAPVISATNIPIRLATTDNGAFPQVFDVGYYSSDNPSLSWNSAFSVNGYTGSFAAAGSGYTGTGFVTGGPIVAGGAGTFGGNVGVTGEISASGDMRVAQGKGFNVNGIFGNGSYSLHSKLVSGTNNPIRLSVASNAVNQQVFEIGYYTSDNEAFSWNGTFAVNGYAGNFVALGVGTMLGGAIIGGTAVVNDITIGGTCTGCGSGSNWTVSGSNIYRNVGSVGIGTTSPGAKLQVDGDLGLGGAPSGGRALGLVGTGGLQGISLNTNSVQWYIDHRGTSDSPNNRFAISTGLSDLFTILSGGNVGIGVSNPASKLSVNGNVAITGNLSFSGTCSGCGVTSIATAGPLTGGTITTSGTIDCPNCATTNTFQTMTGLKQWDSGSGFLTYITDVGVQTNLSGGIQQTFIGRIPIIGGFVGVNTVGGTQTTTMSGLGGFSTTAGYAANGSAGLTSTRTIRNSAGTGTCTLVFTLGILTGGTC